LTLDAQGPVRRSCFLRPATPLQRQFAAPLPRMCHRAGAAAIAAGGGFRRRQASRPVGRRGPPEITNLTGRPRPRSGVPIAGSRHWGGRAGNRQPSQARSTRRGLPEMLEHRPFVATPTSSRLDRFFGASPAALHRPRPAAERRVVVRPEGLQAPTGAANYPGARAHLGRPSRRCWAGPGPRSGTRHRDAPEAVASPCGSAREWLAVRDARLTCWAPWLGRTRSPVPVKLAAGKVICGPTRASPARGGAERGVLVGLSTHAETRYASPEAYGVSEPGLIAE